MNEMFFNPYEMNEGKEQKMFGVMRDYVENGNLFHNFPSNAQPRQQGLIPC